MPDTPIDERRFTDEEVREILKKAVEKRASSTSLVKSEGLSLAELKVIGEEVGIAPDRLEDAARAVALGKVNQGNFILGGPTVLDFERKVPGELDPEDTPEILSLIRRTMGVQGEADEIHGSLEWSAKGDQGQSYVTLSSRDGNTTIRGSSNLTNAAVLSYLPAGMMGLIMTFAGFARFLKSGSEVAMILALVTIPILYPILRTIFSKFSKSEAAKLQRVVDDLARLTEGSGD